MRCRIIVCGCLIVLGVLAGFSQEQRNASRSRFRERGESFKVRQRIRDDHRRDSTIRDEAQKAGIESEFQRVTPAGDSPSPQQSLRQAPLDRVPKSERGEYRSIFQRIQHGMTAGNISAIAQHFGSQVYVNLRGGESGYFSANQAYYLLENYLKKRKMVSFDFSTIGESESNPYATGSAWFNVKGSREVAQIYVSLSPAGSRWVISQINIY